MDLVHDGTSIIAEEDRISNLPKEIIHHILSFLDMKYATQTSKLSRKWKHIWTSMPYLNLNSQAFRTLPQFANFVKHALSRRNNQTEVSVAELTLTGKGTQFVVKSIVNYAYSHNVRQLTMTWVTRNVVEFPQNLFTSHTLKHLTLATKQIDFCSFGQLPESAWDFPALETLNLRNMRLYDGRDKSLNLFSKCVHLKDLTLHGCIMGGLDIFNVCAPQLSNLTITNPVVFPKVFNVVAPQLKNLIASVVSPRYTQVMQLSTDGFNSLENVNLSFGTHCYKKESYVTRLFNLFQKLCSAKFLILDVYIIESLSSCLDQFSHEPCPFNNLKCLKIDTTLLKQEDRLTTMPIQVKNYLLENSPSATFIMNLPQVPHKRLRKQVEAMASRKRMLEGRILLEEQIFAEQKAKLEALKLQHEKSMSQIMRCKMAELQVQVVGGNPDYKLIRSMGCDIKSIIDSTPESLRVAMETQFYCHYEEVKSQFFTHIDASQWEKIETELGCTRHSERTHFDNIHSQLDVPTVALPPAP